MGRYLNAALEYLPAALAAAGGFGALAAGAGSELSDLMRVDTEMTRMGIDIIVSQTALLTCGTAGEGIRKAVYDKDAEEEYV